MMPSLSELRRYVTLGDSSSAGLPDDPYPPWPELLVDDLRDTSPSLAFWNLAVVGATMLYLVDDQLRAAIELRRDLVRLVSGLNDVIRSVRPDADAFRESLLTCLGGLERMPPPPLVVLATMAHVSDYVAFRPRSGARVARGIAAFDSVVRAVAGRHRLPSGDGHLDRRLSERRQAERESMML